MRKFLRNGTVALALENALLCLLGVALGSLTSRWYVGAAFIILAVAVLVLRRRVEGARARQLSRIDERTKLIARRTPPDIPAGAPPVAVAPATPPLESQRGSGAVSPEPARRVQHLAPEPPTASNVAWAEERAIVPGDPRVADAHSWYRPRHHETTTSRIAVICDEFTFNSLAPDADLIALQPDTWREQFEAHRPEIFFCESAWAGMPKDRSPWKGQIYSSIRFGYENRKILLEILNHCKRAGIPTVFWNKEDPTHFADRINDFVATASLFDHILTTAEECVDDYRKLLKRGNVGVLPFAAQPALFHPDPAVHRATDAVFAGAWYGVHPERSLTMATMFDALIGRGLPLTIHDRDFGLNDTTRRFPDRYVHLLKPAVPYARTADLYRRHAFGVNINTVTGSRTMCARRVFELASSGAAVITNASPAMEHFLPGGTLTDADIAGLTLDELVRWRDSVVVRNQEIVLAEHTYARRLSTVFETVGMARRAPAQSLALVAIVSSHASAAAALDRRSHDYDEVLLVVDATVPSHEVGEYYTRYVGPRTAVVSQELMRQGIVDPRSLLGVCFAHIVAPDAEIDSRAGRRLALHAQYSAAPVVPSTGTELCWAAHTAVGAVVNASVVAQVVLAPDTVRTVLEVPAS
ncbi:glycosyltransferase family protein [Cellulomonas hominis]|uniref:glycosyltransferase family protein n=1 Tax=Cellulomonas hominis TaxID=156981 RepID=UPI001443FAD3|nr:glycosyltransferase [Cellulomonas hominis]NKY09737.1 hypothetical protein [Cellulomonas hominis]